MKVENRTNRTVWVGLYRKDDVFLSATTFPWGARYKLEPHTVGDYSPAAERQLIAFWTSGAFGDWVAMPKTVWTTEVTLDEDESGCYTYNHRGSPTPMDKIEHVVVMMLENRSFDNLLGWLYSDVDNKPPRNIPAPPATGTKFLGLREKAYWNTSPAEAHDTAPERDRVYAQKGAVGDTQPNPNPDEIIDSFLEQMYGTAPVSAAQQPNMWGFLHNYRTHTKAGAGAPGIMQCYTPSQVPVISSLAKTYAVCDRWFGSAPCETWPNRSFLHAGTSFGRLNNEDTRTGDKIPNLTFYGGRRTIFDVMDELGVRFGIYQSGPAVTTLLSTQFFTIPQKERRYRQAHLLEGVTGPSFKPHVLWPQYIFIEPNYGLGANDQHPPHSVSHGEKLIETVYNLFRLSGRWNRTLFLLTYDEHGGCYDHVPPPGAVVPDSSPVQFPFPGDFNPLARYGPRVPAILASSYIEPGTVFRASSRESWVDNNDWNANYDPKQGGLANFYIDTNELTCPKGRMVTAIALRQKGGNRVAPRMQHTNYDGSDPKWVQNDDWNANYEPQQGGLGSFYIDTNELTCGEERFLTGIALRRKGGNRVAFRIQHEKYDGSDSKWTQNDDWNANYAPQQGGLANYYIDTNEVSCALGQIRGIALHEKGNRVAPRALITTSAEFDHTSVLASLRDWMGASSEMLPSKRVKLAPTFWHVLTRTSPRMDGVVSAENVPPVVTDNVRPSDKQLQNQAVAEAERRVAVELADPKSSTTEDNWQDRRQRIAESVARELQQANASGTLPPELIGLHDNAIAAQT